MIANSDKLVKIDKVWVTWDGAELIRFEISPTAKGNSTIL